MVKIVIVLGLAVLLFTYAEPVSGIKMKVNDDNKFEVNMEYKVNISAFGS